MRRTGNALLVLPVVMLIGLTTNLPAQTNQSKTQSQPRRQSARSRNASIRYNEAGAINSIRTLFSAEVTFQATTGNGNYGTLEELRRQQLIDYVLTKGHRYGYLFKIRVEKSSSESPAALEITAIPRFYGYTGKRSFYINEEGVIHAADKKGAEANITDEPLDQ